MNHIVNINCSACGAPLKVHENESTIKCKYCGSENLLLHEGNEAANQLNQISPNLDRTASELAIKRLKEELVGLDTKAQSKLENLEIEKNRAFSEIEKKKSISISSPVPAVEKLKNELNMLHQEQNRALKKGKTQLGFNAAINTSMGLIGAIAAFIVSFVIVFCITAIVAGIIKAITQAPFHSEKVVPYFFLIATVGALIFLVGFVKFASYRQKNLSQKISTRQHELEQAISEHQRSIEVETMKNINRVNQEIENQKHAVEKEVEAAKASINKEISDRQEQLEKHYKRVKI